MSRYARVRTSLGTLAIGWGERGVSRILLPAADWHDLDPADVARAGLRSEMRPPRTIAKLAAALRAHLAGDVQNFAGVPLDTAGVPPFALRVLRAAQSIPAGPMCCRSRIPCCAGGSPSPTARAPCRARRPSSAPHVSGRPMPRWPAGTCGARRRSRATAPRAGQPDGGARPYCRTKSASPTRRISSGRARRRTRAADGRDGIRMVVSLEGHPRWARQADVSRADRVLAARGKRERRHHTDGGQGPTHASSLSSAAQRAVERRGFA
jgi:O6-methylguanine-DNA--protein-cysteine methyltransferase